MKNESEPKWERQLDEALKSLPELQAPSSLIPGVLAQVRTRAELPWYRRSWQSWPLAGQASALAVLLMFAGGLCFGVWQFATNEFAATLWSRLSGAFTTIGALWHAAAVLKDAAVLALKHLDAGIVAAGFAVVFFSYLICIGAGTAVVRFALARR